MNSVSPIMNNRRRPNRSASRPPSNNTPPKTIAYAVITHCRLTCEKCRSVLIEGSATFTIATSRTTMNCATTISASTIQRRRSGSGRRFLENSFCRHLWLPSIVDCRHDSTRIRLVRYTVVEMTQPATTDTPGGPDPADRERARGQQRLPARPPRARLQGTGPGERRGVWLRALRLLRARDPQRRRPRDAGDDRRRARPRPQPPRRAPRLTPTARPGRATARPQRPSPPRRQHHHRRPATNSRVYARSSTRSRTTSSRRSITRAARRSTGRSSRSPTQNDPRCCPLDDSLLSSRAGSTTSDLERSTSVQRTASRAV